MVPTLSVIIIAISAIGLVLSIALNRKQQKLSLDERQGPTATKHPILANPILIAYVLFPILIVVGALLVISYS